MNPLNPTTVSRSEFRKVLNLRCHKEFGLGLNELPDIINIEDVWWEGILEKEAIQMIDGCIEDFKDELGDPFKPIHTVDAPVYDINE
jgi:hypothetical protein